MRDAQGYHGLTVLNVSGLGGGGEVEEGRCLGAGAAVWQGGGTETRTRPWGQRRHPGLPMGSVGQQLGTEERKKEANGSRLRTAAVAERLTSRFRREEQPSGTEEGHALGVNCGTRACQRGPRSGKKKMARTFSWQQASDRVTEQPHVSN